MKNFIFVATLQFEAEDEDDAYNQMVEYLANGDTNMSLYSPDSWALDPMSTEDIDS